jgi:hypothetical protein
MTRRRWAVIAILVLVVAAAVAGQVSAAGPPASPPGLQRAIAAQEAHTDALLARAGVVGTAVGLGADGRHVVKIYVEAGAPAGLPHQLDGVPVEVEATGKLLAQEAPIRPAPIGASTGTERLMVYRGQLYCTVGTIAARVRSGTDVYALSNAHVFALQGSQPSGSVRTGVTGDRILQPGRVDMTAQACGSSAEIEAAVIGRLWDYEPIVLSRKASNLVDAAIARLDDADDVGTATPAGGYGTPSLPTWPAAVGLLVQKYGRTTKQTLGKVTGINATVVIGYDAGSARFVKQIVISGTNGSFSDSGDSGSLIVTQSGNHPVALLFAGSSTTTIGNPIDDVLAAFGVTIDVGP